MFWTNIIQNKSGERWSIVKNIIFQQSIIYRHWVWRYCVMSLSASLVWCKWNAIQCQEWYTVRQDCMNDVGCFVSLAGLAHSNGGRDCHQIIGASDSKLLKACQKPKLVIWDVNLVNEEWGTWVTTSSQTTDQLRHFSRILFCLSPAHLLSSCSSTSHTSTYRLCCPAQTEWTCPFPQASCRPISGPLRRCVGVRWRGGMLRAAAEDCDVRAQQPGREPAWRSQILRGLRGRWERGPGGQHEDRHGAVWGWWRHRLGGRPLSWPFS